MQVTNVLKHRKGMPSWVLGESTMGFFSKISFNYSQNNDP
jgi:hypothetical protein